MKTKLFTLALLLLGAGSFAQTADEIAVRKVIDTETLAFHEANSELIAAQWSNKPYIERQQADLLKPTGAPFLKGENLQAFANSYLKSLKPSGRTVRVTDYDVHISGATAWATFMQETIDKEGASVSKKREIRVLERESDGWKIVFLSNQDTK